MITHQYTLLCDDIRQEAGGKFLIVGLYTPDIVVPAVPFTIATLAFFVSATADRVGDVSFSFRLTHGETILTSGLGRLTIAQAGTVPITLRIAGVTFQSAGRYRLVLEMAGQPSITHEFLVQLPQ